MYAMLEAKVGVIMDGGAKVPLINIEAGAVLQGRLPNPFWGEGAFGVNIRALGGIIKYKGNFQMTLGQPCTIVGKSASTSVPNVQLISELSPYHETSEVSVEINPTVIFAAPMDKPITTTSNDGSVTKTYTVKLDTVELRSYVGVLIPAELIWADATNKTKLKLKPYYFLPPNDSVTLLVSASYTDNQGVITRERKVSKFVTSDAPMFIPTSNVRGAYPMDGQYNLYREEYQVMVEGVKQSRGNISLHKGQPYLLENPDYEIQVQFTQSGSLNKIMTKADYKESEEELSYELPNTLLKNTLYKQEVLAKSTIGKPNLVLYTTYFRVSKYKDFTTKMKFFANNLLTVSPEESFVVSVEHDVMDEPFDAYELGVTGTGLPKTVDLDADFTKWKWLYHEAGFPYAMYEYWNKVAPKLGYASIAFPDDYVVNLAQTDSKNNSYPAPLLNMKDNQKVYISADDWKNGKSGIPDKYRISVNVGLPNIMKFDAVTIANSIKSAIINNKCDGFDTNTLNSSSCPLFANNWNIGFGNLIEFFGTGGMSGFKGKNTNSEAVKGKGFEPPQKDDEFPVWLRYRLPSKEKSSADQLIEIIAN
jgi:hypothetical protein